MNFRYHFKGEEEAELDVTSFMNLMIVLVPVLLLSMTFTQITVLDVKLPELTGGPFNSDSSQSQLDVLVNEKGFKVFYPSNVMLQEIPVKTETLEDGTEVQSYNYLQLSRVMQEIKKQLPDKRDVVIRLSRNVDYQNLITTMQNVKSYQTIIAASVIEVELFPEVSLGDAMEEL